MAIHDVASYPAGLMCTGVSRKKTMKKNIFIALSSIIFAGCTEPGPVASNNHPVKSVDSTSIMVSRYQEGVHYQVLKTPFDVKGPELREFFSYACQHCFSIEPIVSSLHHKSGINVVRNHVPHLRIMPRADQDRLTAGLLVSIDMGVEESFSRMVFKAIHESGQKQFSEADVTGILKIATGNDSSDYKNLLANASASKEFEQSGVLSYDLLHSKQIPGVPSFVINGKYLVDMKNMSQTDLANDISELTQYLQSLDVR